MDPTKQLSSEKIAPSNRKSVQSLIEWMSERLKETERETSTATSKEKVLNSIVEAQEIFTVTFQTINKQVLVQCAERGKLLQKIWEEYLSLFDAVLKIRESEKEEYNVKMDQQKEIYRKLYQAKDDTFTQLYLQLASEKQSAKIEHDKLQRAVASLHSEFQRRNIREKRIRQVVSYLKQRVTEVTGIADNGLLKLNDEQTQKSEFDNPATNSVRNPEFDPALISVPENATSAFDFFAGNSLLLCQKLNFILSKLDVMNRKITSEEWEPFIGIRIQMEGMMNTLRNTIALIAAEENLSIDSLKQGEAGDSLGATNTQNEKSNAIPTFSSSLKQKRKFMIDKAAQINPSDFYSNEHVTFNGQFLKSNKDSSPSVFLQSFADIFSKSFKVYTPHLFEQSLVLNYLLALFSQCVIFENEKDKEEKQRAFAYLRKDVSFSQFVHQFFISLFGLKEIAETNLFDFLYSVNYYLFLKKKNDKEIENDKKPEKKVYQETEVEQEDSVEAIIRDDFNVTFNGVRDLTSSHDGMNMNIEGKERLIIFSYFCDKDCLFSESELHFFISILSLILDRGDLTYGSDGTAQVSSKFVVETIYNIFDEIKVETKEKTIDFDKFILFLLKHFQTFTKESEKNFSISFNASVALSSKNIMIYEEYSSFMRHIAPEVPELLLQKSFLNIICKNNFQDNVYNLLLNEAKSMKIVKNPLDRSYSVITVDKKKPNDIAIQLLSIILLMKSDTIQLQLQRISQIIQENPAMHKNILVLQETYGDMMRCAEMKDNYRLFLLNFRTFHEQCFYMLNKIPF